MSRAYLAFTAKGEALARRLAEALPGSVSRCGGDVTLKGWTAEHFAQDEALIFVGAVGIAVRAIAPHCRSKAADPAVVVVDEGGNFAVPLLSGHLGGANALARALAKACGAVPVITTATDVNGLFAVDLWAKAQNCAVLEPERIKRVSGALLAGQTVRYWSPWPVAGETPAGVNALCLSGRTLYAAGHSGGAAAVWKDKELLYTLTDGSSYAEATAVCRFGHTLYTAGYHTDGFEEEGVVWKEGQELFDLSDGSGSGSMPYSVAVCYDDIFTAGTIFGTTRTAVVWHGDEIRYTLSDGTGHSEAYSMYVVPLYD